MCEKSALNKLIITMIITVIHDKLASFIKGLLSEISEHTFQIIKFLQFINAFISEKKYSYF
jgi:hypothetical protein